MVKEIEKIAIAADHRGVALKRILTNYLGSLGVAVSDLGVSSETPSDYPDVAFPLSEKVARGEFERGILVCSSGAGMAICANKVRGIRAAIAESVDQARLIREHNDCNVLILGSKFVDPKLGREIARVFLETPFEGGRHAPRVEKIKKYEGRGTRKGDALE